jgi:hypothetical protein
MRHNTNVEVKYQDDNGEEKLDDSKEEEMPLMQIARVIEKNGMSTLIIK